MRLVPNLNEVYFCPNCDSPELYTIKDLMNNKEHKYCPRCHEEIYEGNITSDNLTFPTPSTSFEEAKTHTIKIDNEATARREQEEKEKFLFNLREEIDSLRYNIHDAYSMILINKLTDIFTQIADYIENH